MMRRFLRWAAAAGLSVAILAAPVVIHQPASAEQSPESAADVPIISVQVAVDQPIIDDHVSLDVLPQGYVPAVGLDDAAQLAFAQLGPAAAPTGALVYLGTGVEGAPVWVFTYEGVCGQPNPGLTDDSAECLEDTLSIALDAESGAFLVAW
jgi:Flp pilus assembly protein CpaB